MRGEATPSEISRNTPNLKSNFRVFLLISRSLTLLSQPLSYPVLDFQQPDQAERCNCLNQTD